MSFTTFNDGAAGLVPREEKTTPKGANKRKKNALFALYANTRQLNLFIRTH